MKESLELRLFKQWFGFDPSTHKSFDSIGIDSEFIWVCFEDDDVYIRHSLVKEIVNLDNFESIMSHNDDAAIHLAFGINPTDEQFQEYEKERNLIKKGNIK